MGYPMKYPEIGKKGLACTIAQALSKSSEPMTVKNPLVISLMSMYTRRELEEIYPQAVAIIPKIVPEPPASPDDEIMRKRIKAVMKYRSGNYFVGDMVMDKIKYYLNKLHMRSTANSPTTLAQVYSMINRTRGKNLEHIYGILESYIDHMLKNDICTTCNRPKHN